MTTPLDTIKGAILGVPYDASKKPSRQGTVKAFSEMQVQLEGAQAGALVKDSLAALTALTSVSEASVMAWVTNDATQANNGIYENTGTDVAPAWTRRLDIPQFVISGVNVGAGTANAIQATTDLPIPVQDGRTLIMLPIIADNTGPATVAFNGGPVLPILSIASNPLIADNLLDGMFVSGFINSGNFTLITDVDSAANAATAAAAAAAAVISAAAALVSETNTAVSAAAALVSETNAAVSADASLAAAVAGNLSGLDLAAGAGLQVAVNEAGDALEFVDVVTFYKGADVASAAELLIGENDTSVNVTGTTDITSIEHTADAQPIGAIVTLQFDDVVVITHHATDLVLPNGVNITTAAGDLFIFEKYAAGDWRLHSSQRANEEPLIAGYFVGNMVGYSGSATTICRYFIRSQMVTMEIQGSFGNSNITSFTITGMPDICKIESGLANLEPFTQVISIEDNGADAFGLVEIKKNDNVIYLHPSATIGAAWTASGQKGLNSNISFTYRKKDVL